MLKSFAVAFLFAPVAAERLSIGKTKFINAMVSFMDVSMARGEIPAIKELLQSLGEGTWTNTSNFTSALEDIIDLVDDQITHVMELQVEAKKAIDGNKATVQSSHAVASDALAAAKIRANTSESCLAEEFTIASTFFPAMDEQHEDVVVQRSALRAVENATSVLFTLPSQSFSCNMLTGNCTGAQNTFLSQFEGLIGTALNETSSDVATYNAAVAVYEQATTNLNDSEVSVSSIGGDFGTKQTECDSHAEKSDEKICTWVSDQLSACDDFNTWELSTNSSQASGTVLSVADRKQEFSVMSKAKCFLQNMQSNNAINCDTQYNMEDDAAFVELDLTNNITRDMACPSSVTFTDFTFEERAELLIKDNASAWVRQTSGFSVFDWDTFVCSDSISSFNGC